jgi:hypothetical protein
MLKLAKDLNFSTIKKLFLDYWFIFFLILARIPTFFEVWWYGDENIYMAIAHTMNNSGLLYVDTWDHKPPFIYLIYSLSYYIFGDLLFPVRILNLLLNLLFLCIYNFVLIKYLNFSTQFTKISLVLLSFSFTFILEAQFFNAENIFMPMVWGGLAFFILAEKRFNTQTNFYQFLFFGSLLWFLATITKANATIEILGLGYIFLVTKFPNYSFNRNIFKQVSTYFTNFKTKTPFSFYFIVSNFFIIIAGWAFLSGFYLYKNHFNEFIYAVFQYNRIYINSTKLNFYFFEITDLQLKILITLSLTCGISLLYLLQKISQRSFIIFIWTVVLMFSTLTSGKGYSHYLLQILPLFIIQLQLLFLELKKLGLTLFFKKISISILVFTWIFYFNIFTFQNNFYISYYYPNKRLIFLYTEVLKQKLTPQIKETLMIINDQTQLIQKIKEKTNNEDEILILANRPELYFLADRKQGYKYVVDYHFSNSDLQSLDLVIKNNSKIRLILVDKNIQNVSLIDLKLKNTDFVFIDSFSNLDFYTPIK